MRIRCLEQGDWMASSRYPTTARNWEAQAFGAFHVDPNVRRLPADYPVDNSDSPIDVLNFNAVRGSTIAYAAHFPQPHPSEFRVPPPDGVAPAWPPRPTDPAPDFVTTA